MFSDGEMNVPTPVKVEQTSRQIHRERFIFTSAQPRQSHLESHDSLKQTFMVQSHNNVRSVSVHSPSNRSSSATALVGVEGQT